MKLRDVLNLIDGSDKVEIVVDDMKIQGDVCSVSSLIANATMERDVTDLEAQNSIIRIWLIGC